MYYFGQNAELKRTESLGGRYVKRIIIALAIANIIGGVLQANTVISCSGTAAAVNSCYSSNLPAFNTRLDWAVFGSPDGSSNNGVWTTNAGGITVSAQNQGGLGLRLADNYASVFTNGHWVLASNLANQPYSLSGHFDAPSDVMPSSAVTPGYPRDTLIGLKLNGVSAAANMLLDYSAGLNGVGFRIAATNNSTFDARVRLFSGLNGTGTLLEDYTFVNLNGGGTCASLFVTNSNPPKPCDDAPYVGFTGYNYQL